MIVGLPRMHLERGELRDFLPDYVSFIAHTDISGVVVEEGYGSGMGLSDEDYLRRSPKIKLGSYEDCLRQDVVIVLRAPGIEAIGAMRPGALLVSMLHYTTHRRRNEAILRQGLRAVSLDSLVDDRGRRLVENMTSVGWSAMEATFIELRHRLPGFDETSRPPIRVTILGAGAVAGAAASAAARYGDPDLHSRMVSMGAPGVEVTLIDYDLTSHPSYMKGRLEQTDVLADTTRRRDPKVIAIPNAWLASLPQHAVVADLAADPYDFTMSPPLVKAIEGVPHGNLDHYVFTEDDPAYDLLGEHVDVTNRRLAVSCYSWPGIHPRACMEVYGSQLETFMHVILHKAPEMWDLSSDDHMERALARAEIGRWTHTSTSLR